MTNISSTPRPRRRKGMKLCRGLIRNPSKEQIPYDDNIAMSIEERPESE